LAQAPATNSCRQEFIITNSRPAGRQEVTGARQNIRVREGEPYVRAAVDADGVRNLMKTGYFSTCVLTEEVTANGSTSPTFFSGNRKITDIHDHWKQEVQQNVARKETHDETSAILSTSANSSTDAEEIKNCIRNRLFAGRSKVHPKHGLIAQGRASVTFEVTETPRSASSIVYFEGAKRLPAEETAQGHQDARRMDVFMA
jgi:outer membrane protein assembly factor BamA